MLTTPSGEARVNAEPTPASSTDGAAEDARVFEVASRLRRAMARARGDELPPAAGGNGALVPASIYERLPAALRRRVAVAQAMSILRQDTLGASDDDDAEQLVEAVAESLAALVDSEAEAAATGSGGGAPDLDVGNGRLIGHGAAEAIGRWHPRGASVLETEAAAATAAQAAVDSEQKALADARAAAATPAPAPAESARMTALRRLARMYVDPRGQAEREKDEERAAQARAPASPRIRRDARLQASLQWQRTTAAVKSGSFAALLRSGAYPAAEPFPLDLLHTRGTGRARATVELLSSEPSPPAAEAADDAAASSAAPSAEGDDARTRAGVFTGTSAAAPQPVYEAKPGRRKAAKPRAVKKPDDGSESD